MDGLRQTAFQLILAASVSALSASIIPSSGTKGLMRMICGIFLSLTLLSQFRNIDIKFITDTYQAAAAAAEKAVLSGTQQASVQLHTVIKNEWEAYILDKAADLGANIHVDLVLAGRDPPIPSAVSIYGSVTEEIKTSLQTIIASDLGIAKEDQMWIS